MRFKEFSILQHKFNNNKWFAVTGLRKIEKKVREIEIKKFRMERKETVGWSA